MRRRACPTQAELSDFAVGRLSRIALTDVADHLDGCTNCLAVLEKLDSGTDPLVARLREPDDPAATDETLPPDLVSSLQSAGPRPSQSAASWTGPRRVGRFELQEELGGGSFGFVLRARDTELDRSVAIKILRAGSLATTEDVDRFLREARAAAQLKHPGIVSLYETGRTPDGTYYLVEEFIQGRTLAHMMNNERPDFRRSVQLTAQVADALGYAHRNGVIHRDIKPSNIMLDPEGRPHLMDFGLAKRGAEDVEMTMIGQVLGTPAYMSPEQARGDSRDVDARTDIYCLGVVLYELLTGERPFRGNRRMLLSAVLNDEPRPPRRLDDRIPRDLETICLKAMAKSSSRRYDTAAEFADDLRRWSAGEPIRARPVGRLERAVRWCRRNPLPVSLLAAVVPAAAFGFWSLSRLSEQLIRSSALESAAQQSEMMDAINNLYSADVVERLKPLNVAVTHDFADRPGAIPLPATLTIKLGKHISDESRSGVQVRLFSDFPLRKDNGPKDDFEHEAIRQLKADPDRPFYRFELYKNKPSLRYAVARREQESCTKCHNQFPAPAKRDWKEGDVRGVLEIIRPLEADVERARVGMRGTFALTAITCVTLFAASGLAIFVGNRRRRPTPDPGA